MKHSGILSEKPASCQLLILLLFVLLGSCLALLLGALASIFLYGNDGSLPSDAGAMRLLQFLSACGMFLAPSLLMGWLCGKSLREYLWIGKCPSFRLLAATFLSMLLIAPGINLLGYFNSLIHLPEFLAPLETWMRVQEEQAERITGMLLEGEGWGVLAANLFVVALTAAITEEFLFRGTLERIFSRWTANHHLVIWSAAFLFSAFHLQFFGFLPRLLLGAYFGYLLYWSRNIWLPVFAHFTNNAIAVIGMSDSRLKENEWISGAFSPDAMGEYTLVALAGLFLFSLLVKRELRKNRSF